MELTPYVDAMRRDLATATALADDPTRQIAERLGATLDTSARLAMFDVLSQACAEISVDLAPGAVEVRLAGRDPQFVVTAPPPVRPSVSPPPQPAASPEPALEEPGAGSTRELPAGDEDGEPADLEEEAGESEEEGSARITLRLPATLKRRVDDAATELGVSANTWLVHAVTEQLRAQRVRPHGNRGDRGAGRRRRLDIDLGRLGRLEFLGDEIADQVNEAVGDVTERMGDVAARLGKAVKTPGTHRTGWTR